MKKPILTETEKQYLAHFLGGNLAHPSTPFEARALIEQAISRLDLTKPAGALHAAGLSEWANEVDPQGATIVAGALN